MRLRVPTTLIVLTAAVYLLWSWSVAGGHDVTAIVSGVALVPLFIMLVALAVRGAATVLGRAALWPRRRTQRGSAKASPRRRRSRSAPATMVADGHGEPTAPGVSTPSSAKIAA